MKTRLFLISAAAIVATLTSCKEKELPWIKMDESNYCSEAKALLPSAALKDSLNYLFGIQFATQASYGYKGIDMDRFEKAVSDFNAVDFDKFNEAAQTNFSDEYEDADRFELNPGLLGEILNKAASTEEEAVTPGLRDSVSYIYGVYCAFNMHELDLNASRVEDGMKAFFSIDTDKQFMEHAQNHFEDSTYVDYAKQFEIAPDKFQTVYNAVAAAKEAALMKNYEVQSKVFVEKAAKVKNFKTQSVTYNVMGTDSLATSKIIYRVDQKGSSKQVAFGDSFKVTYKGLHIDESSFDDGEFPVDNFSDQGLIKGFIEALLLMHDGEKLTVVIPSELAYGEQGSRQWWSRTYTIFPNETLVFELSVSDLVKAGEETPAEEPAEENDEENDEEDLESLVINLDDAE